MNKEIVIMLAEDDEGHAQLIIHNLRKAGIVNEILHFTDGEKTLNYLFRKGNTPYRDSEISYILLLDIRMPKVDGMEVLRQVKQDDIMSNFPVIMVTTTDEPGIVKKCYDMGCTHYVVKPIKYDAFVETIYQLGQFIMTMDAPA